MFSFRPVMSCRPTALFVSFIFPQRLVCPVSLLNSNIRYQLSTLKASTVMTNNRVYMHVLQVGSTGRPCLIFSSKLNVIVTIVATRNVCFSPNLYPRDKPVHELVVSIRCMQLGVIIFRNQRVKPPLFSCLSLFSRKTLAPSLG
ncbi:hypothetical protein EDB82DRAFT_320234 [Fusarium venenatum]|uniref:uncharacterized protein n=1 Tax=Fusarium venenatum TaxID=56646 RepID=UPI001D577129|nr:hypothetical protein EDB82DRAFT_320234 [Fusarium venenatum]